MREVKTTTTKNGQRTRFQTKNEEHILVDTTWTGYLYETVVYVTDEEGKILIFQALEQYMNSTFAGARECYFDIVSKWYYGDLKVKDFLQVG